MAVTGKSLFAGQGLVMNPRGQYWLQSCKIFVKELHNGVGSWLKRIQILLMWPRKPMACWSVSTIVWPARPEQGLFPVLSSGEAHLKSCAEFWPLRGDWITLELPGRRL